MSIILYSHVQCSSWEANVNVGSELSKSDEKNQMDNMELMVPIFNFKNEVLREL